MQSSANRIEIIVPWIGTRRRSEDAACCLAAANDWGLIIMLLPRQIL